MDNILQNFKNLFERQSLDHKQQFISSITDKIFEKLNTKEFLVCWRFSSHFGKFYGLEIILPAVDETSFNIYFGRIDGESDYDGAADYDSHGNNAYVIVINHAFYELIMNIESQLDRNKTLAKTLNIDELDDISFMVSDHDKNTLSHELSHVYDLIYDKGKINSKYKWSTRPEEFEAELNALYNSLIHNINILGSKKEFDSKFPLTVNGILKLIKMTDSKMDRILSFAKENKTKIPYKKMLNRIVQVREKIKNQIKI